MIEYRSGEINLIMQALAKAQGGYKPLVANQYWSGQKYANLQAILDATRDALSSNALAFYQYTELTDSAGPKLLRSVLGHDSGQFISSYTRIISGDTDRQTGNSLEINKRLQALMLLGIAPLNDPIAMDDGGEWQSEEKLFEAVKLGKDRPVSDALETITESNYKDLLVELHEHPNIVKEILQVYGIKTLADLPKQDHLPVVQRIRKIKEDLKQSYPRRR